jgi:quercetin dioxygenase-like cupin family protein
MRPTFPDPSGPSAKSIHGEKDSSESWQFGFNSGGGAMAELEARMENELQEAPASPGISRHLAFEGDGIRALRSRGDPGNASGWHHQGDYDVYGFVVSGKARFEKAEDGGEAITVGAGDFFHVPPHTIHHESNPSDEGAEVILFIKGSGPLVTNVEGGAGG